MPNGSIAAQERRFRVERILFRVPTEHARVFGVSVEAVAADVLPREEGEAMQQLDHLLHLM